MNGKKRRGNEETKQMGIYTRAREMEEGNIEQGVKGEE